MNRGTYHIIAEDIKAIRQGLRDFDGYDFAEDIAGRMRARNLSKNALAAQALVSHTMVDKWLNHGAKPHGKERYKELGLALGMDEEELNKFLRANSYPGLYAKNPLDVICRFVLSHSRGHEHMVQNYRAYIERNGLVDHILLKDPVEVATDMLSHDFSQVQSTVSMDLWMHDNAKHFRAFGKTYIPHARLIHFLLLFIGEQTINNLYITGELPLTVKNMLYPLLADKEIAIRGLRSKLIVYGLYENMTEDEIDAMLTIAKLRPITEASSRTEQVILTALRRAHERYPYFVLANTEKVLSNLELCGEMDLHALYVNRKRQAQELTRRYQLDKNEQDGLFEQLYTNFDDKNLLHYLRDILNHLVEAGDLSPKETEEYTTLMQTYSSPEE